MSGVFAPSACECDHKVSRIPVSTYLLFVTNDQCRAPGSLLLSMSPLSPDLGRAPQSVLFSSAAVNSNCQVQRFLPLLAPLALNVFVGTL